MKTKYIYKQILKYPSHVSLVLMPFNSLNRNQEFIPKNNFVFLEYFSEVGCLGIVVMRISMILCSMTILKERTGFPTGTDFAAITDEKRVTVKSFWNRIAGKMN